MLKFVAGAVGRYGWKGKGESKVQRERKSGAGVRFLFLVVVYLVHCGWGVFSLIDLDTFFVLHLRLGHLT